MQQLDEFWRERAAFRRVEEEDAFDPVAIEQRQRRGGADAVAAGIGLPGLDPVVGQHVVAEAGLARAESGSRQPSAFRHLVGRGEFEISDHIRVRPVASNDAKQLGIVIDERDVGRGELGAFRRRFANEVEELGPRACAQDRLIGRAQCRVHARQAVFLLGDPRLLGLTVEIVDREADVLGDAQHERDDPLILRPGLAEEGQDDADALAVPDQGGRDAGGNTRVEIGLLPRRSPGATREITFDMGLLGSKHLAGNAATIGILGVDGVVGPGHDLQILAGAGDRLQPMRVLLFQQNEGRQRLAAVHRGVAHELIQFPLGLRTQDGFVGRAERAEHAVEPPRRELAGLPRGLAREIVQRIGDVGRHALEQRHHLLVQ
ncbi:hypothetical protein ACVWZ3_007620 [Bradyrhizobium sp. i1.3.6]